MPVISQDPCFVSWVHGAVLSLLRPFEFSDFAAISGHYILWVNMNTRNLELWKRQGTTNGRIGGGSSGGNQPLGRESIITTL